MTPVTTSSATASMAEWASLIAALAPVVQTIVWASLVVFAATFLRAPLMKFANAVAERVQRGDPITWGNLTLNPQLKSLSSIEPADELMPVTEELAGVEWTSCREAAYERSHNIFLVHVATPSSKPGQKYDVYIFLFGHKRSRLDTVERAEFFLGKSWGNRIFEEFPKDGLIGLRTSAYGSFLCVCRVHLKGGKTFMLERYIDFEMVSSFAGGAP